jgi:large subunit ribosomal protein L19
MGLYLEHNETKFQVGDTVRVYQKIKEGKKERTQVFEGLVIKVKGHEGSKSFTVRKISSGIGVEKIFPIDSPFVEKVEVTRKGQVRRAKLYYLRDRTGRSALKVRERRDNVVVAKEKKNVKKAAAKTKVKEESTEKKAGKAGGGASKAEAVE